MHVGVPATPNRYDLLIDGKWTSGQNGEVIVSADILDVATSGLGRESGRHGLEEYTELKTITAHFGLRTGWWHRPGPAA